MPEQSAVLFIFIFIFVFLWTISFLCFCWFLNFCFILCCIIVSWVFLLHFFETTFLHVNIDRTRSISTNFLHFLWNYLLFGGIFYTKKFDVYFIFVIMMWFHLKFTKSYSFVLSLNHNLIKPFRVCCNYPISSYLIEINTIKSYLTSKYDTKNYTLRCKVTLGCSGLIKYRLL